LYDIERELRVRAEEAREREQFLADATKILNESLQLEDILESLTMLAVPRIADWCAIHLTQPDGSVALAAVAHEDPAQVQLARDYAERYRPDPEQPGTAAHVALTGRTHVVREITDEMLARAARDVEHLEMVRKLGLRSSMTVPLSARGETLGALTMVSSRADHLFDEDDVMFAQEFASRAALAVANARLYQSKLEIARTLQDSLLPPMLPSIPGLSMAAEYRASAEGADVGGDFYDVFRVGGRSWVIVMGDVCGKDATAAAITALARYTIRAEAAHSKRPSSILTNLNDAIIRQSKDDRFCTAVLGVLTVKADGVHVALASGGHPLPMILRASGRVESVGRFGTLLGVFPTVDLHDAATRLEPGDTLLFFTDGCLEVRHDGDLFGQERLAAVLSRCAGVDPPELVSSIASGVADFAGGSLSDDVAILAVKALPPDA
jgi:serine phosphatase RsbU (regulator of sigma subunit)